MNDKLILLTENFTALEDHIAVMKNKLISADAENKSLEDNINHQTVIIREKEAHLSELTNLEIELKKALQDSEERERRR